MTYEETKYGFVVRLFRGEEVMSTLTNFCAQESIASASLSGIGAVGHAVFGCYNLDEKEYAFQTFDRLMELVSMQGNVSLVDGKPFLHVHAAFGDTDLRVYGGHVKEMTVGVTVEVQLETNDIAVRRVYDEAIGLNLFDLSCQFAPA